MATDTYHPSQQYESPLWQTANPNISPEPVGIISDALGQAQNVAGLNAYQYF